MDGRRVGRYIRDVDVVIAAGIVAAALVVLVVGAFARIAWRILRHNETLEPGGSYGRQVFGRRR